jgi:hypothetical protein
MEKKKKKKTAPSRARTHREEEIGSELENLKSFSFLHPKERWLAGLGFCVVEMS